MCTLGNKKTIEKSAGIGCLALFLIFWLGIVGGFDFVLTRQFLKLQSARSSFESAPAEIIRSEVQTHSSSDGSKYGVAVEYQYTVDGEEYTSDQFSYFNWLSSSKKNIEEKLSSFPLGAVVKAHYNPDEPSEAMLEIGLDSFPSIIILFLIPFHCFGFGLLIELCVQIRRARLSKQDYSIAKLLVQRSKSRVILRDSSLPSWMVFMCVFGVASFISIFVVPITMGGFNASHTVVYGAIIGCFGFAIILTIVQWIRRKNRSKRIMIDLVAGRFTRVPSSVGVSMSDLTSIVVRDEDSNTKMNEEKWYKHTVYGLDKEGQEILLLKARGNKGFGSKLKKWFSVEFELNQ
ncbi:MAG: DUF3592 domain-containing protein [Phycisphaerales bacterium]|nr:DUF3592 domain-containing protein [Phycisphaerales bacterium]